MSENQEDFNSQEEFNDLKKLVLSILEKTIDTSHTLDNNFEYVKEKLAKIEVKVDKLALNTGEEFTNVDGKLDDIHSELKKIEKVSRYTEEFENLLKVTYKSSSK